MLFLVKDEVSDIRQTARVGHAAWLPINVAVEHLGVQLMVLVHEHELLAQLVLEIRQIASRSFFDRRRRRMTIAHPQQFTLAHPTTITGGPAKARAPAREAAKATVAAQASPYGLGLSQRRSLCIPSPAGGSILNRRHGVNSQPALTI